MGCDITINSLAPPAANAKIEYRHKEPKHGRHRGNDKHSVVGKVARAVGIEHHPRIALSHRRFDHRFALRPALSINGNKNNVFISPTLRQQKP